MNSTLEYLYSLQKFGMKFGLRNIRSLLHSVGDPYKKIKTIHIAGTNGKGSTSSMIAAVLTAAGYNVGLYTSPHLVKFNERIRINGRMISDSDIVRYTKKLKPQIQKLKATFFEATTAMAFNYFADEKVDIAVIETGLGGRLDSTNVILPLVSVITSIGKDHTEQLGNTLGSIAREKAGIIKSNIPVVIGAINGSAKKVIAQTAKEKKSLLIESKKLKLPSDIHIQLKGEHQITNAKAAIAAINVVSKYFLIDKKAIREGLENTSQLTGLRARFEFIQRTPNILLDVAHNPGAIQTLVSELKKLTYKKFVIVFAVMKDKDFRSILKQFKRFKCTIITTQPKVERALPSEQLYAICKEMKLNSLHAPTVRDALNIGKKITGKNDLLVVTGSHFLVGEAIAILQK